MRPNYGHYVYIPAVVYGQGVYFAKEFSYSAQGTYSPAKVSSGEKFVFLCKILTGHHVVGDQQMRYLPIRTGNITYDSAVNNSTNPTIFVIFSDAQAYPEYIVTFK